MNEEEKPYDKDSSTNETNENYKNCDGSLRKMTEIFENSKDFEEIKESIKEMLKERDISPEIDRFRGRFIGPLIRIENDLDRFLKRYFSTIEKEDEFQEKILERNFFTLQRKVEIFNSTVNNIVEESEEPDTLEEKKPNSHLEKIKEYRNKFAHDEIVHRGPNTFGIKTDNGIEIINEEYKNQFDEKVKKARTGIDFFYHYMLEVSGKKVAAWKKDLKRELQNFLDIDEYDREHMDQENIKISEKLNKILNDETEQED